MSMDSSTDMVKPRCFSGGQLVVSAAREGCAGPREEENTPLTWSPYETGISVLCGIYE